MNTQQVSVQSTTDKTLPNSKQRRMLKRALERQEKVQDGDISPEQDPQPSGDPATETFQQESLTSVVQGSGADQMDLEERKSSQDELLVCIQLLETELKKEKDQNVSFKAFHKQSCDEGEVKILQMEKHYEEQLKAKERYIHRLKLENTTSFEKQKRKAMDAVQKEREASDRSLTYLRGHLMNERKKVQHLQRVIEAANINVPLDLSSLQSSQQLPPIQQEQTSAAQSQEEPHQETPVTSSSVQQERAKDQHKIKQLEKEGRDMKREIANLKSQLCEKNTVTNETQRKAKCWREEKHYLTLEVQKLQEEKAEMKTDRDKLRLEVCSLKSDMNAKTVESKETQTPPLRKAQNMQEELWNLRQEVEKLQEEKTAVQKERDGLCVEVVALKTQLSEKTVAAQEPLNQAQTQDEEKAALQAERDGLYSQVDHLKSALLQRNKALEEAQIKVQTLQKEKAGLKVETDFTHSQGSRLKSTLVENNTAFQEAQKKMKNLEEEKCCLQDAVKNLETALRKQRKAAEEASSKVSEQEQEIRKQKTMTQGLQQQLRSAQDKFRTSIQACHARFTAVRAEKERMGKKMQDLSRETEILKAEQKKEMSLLQRSGEEKRTVLQQKILELSDALKASQENNSALLTHNQQLQQNIQNKEEQIQETENQLKKKKRRWFGLCLGL